MKIQGFDDIIKPLPIDSMTHRSGAIDETFTDPRQFFELTKSQGRYQKRLVIFFSIMSMSTATVNYSLPFIFYSPTFKCKNSSGELYTCTELEACASKTPIPPTSDKFSIVDDYKLYCDNHKSAVWGKSFIFVVSSTLTLLIMILSDYWGRVRTFYTSWAVILIGSCIVNFTSPFYLKIIGIGLLKTGIHCFFSGTYLYTSEIIG